MGTGPRGRCTKRLLSEDIVEDWRVCEAEFQNELTTAFRKGMPRRVVALIRAGGDVTKYWHWRALHTLGFVCVEDMSILHKISKWPFLLFSPFVTIKEKREGEP